MKTYDTLLADVAKYTPLTVAANSPQIAEWVNDGIRYALGSHAWPFLEKTSTLASVASQQFYQLPYDYGQLISAITTIGTTQYVPIECPNREQWNILNTSTAITSDIPKYYIIFGNTIGFWPMPASNAGTYTFTYKKAVKDLSISDYSTGTIVSVANGGIAVVGSGTTWAVSMAGRYLQIAESNTANKGDGFWYQIASSASTTSITLTAPYGGTAISAGAATYTIGQMSVLPENYQSLPIWYATAEYWGTQREIQRYDYFRGKFDEGVKQMLEEFGQKSESAVIDNGPWRGWGPNPNNYPRNIGS